MSDQSGGDEWKEMRTTANKRRAAALRRPEMENLFFLHFFSNLHYRARPQFVFDLTIHHACFCYSLC